MGKSMVTKRACLCTDDCACLNLCWILLFSSSSPSPYEVYELTVVGLAFLWHQIRCMVSILFLVGNGLEKPEVCVCDTALRGSMD